MITNKDDFTSENMTAAELASHIHWDATTGCHVISGKDKFTKTYFKYEKQYKYVKIKKN